MQSGPPSIKEALELARSVMLADRDLYEVGHSERLRYDEAIRNIEVSLATFQPDGERREAIALALAERWPGDYMQGDDECEREPNALAYEVADVALSSVGLSSAAICALEESRSLVEWLLEGRELDAMDQIRIGKWSAACQKADALATLQPDGERREAVARMIEEAMRDTWNDICDDTNCHPIDIEQLGNRALAFNPDHWSRYTGESAADKILASGLVQDEAGIRDDERERCVAIISSPPNVPETHRFIFNGEVFKDSRGNELFIAKADVETLLNDFVAAIRSARDGGAES